MGCVFVGLSLAFHFAFGVMVPVIGFYLIL
jgi:hypothetical protein